MKWSFTVVVLVLNSALLSSCKRISEGLIVSKDSQNTVALKRSLPLPVQPNKTCDNSTEGQSEYDPETPNNVWICKNSEWVPHRLLSSLGLSKQQSGRSCQHIQYYSPTHCQNSGAYWVQEMQVYCEMDTTLDKGGWMLVWQHSYMEDLPLTTNMTFFSDYYKPCTQHATSWCNIPNKARFNPTEQMIVAYLNKQIIYAYKGVFNRNIDYGWSGGYLMAYTGIIDKCSYDNGHPPSPVKSLPGIAFSKHSGYCNYYGSGGTITGTLTNPGDNRWSRCRTNSYSSGTGQQMTIAIYIR